MSKRVLLQAGHSALFPPFLVGGGGAPGEAAWTADWALRLKARLAAAGVECVVVGAWLTYQNGAWVHHAPPPEALADYDLFVPGHYDGSTDPAASGCCAGRAAKDPVGARSDAFVHEWTARYPAATGIPLHQERATNNPNITDYYAFRDTSDATPGGLLEHGYGACADHAALFDAIDAIVEADAASILAFLGIVQPEPPPPEPAPEDDMTPQQQAILDKMAQLGADAASIDGWLSQIGRAREIGGVITRTKRVPAAIKPLGAELAAWP